jgi:hypothetical protein
MSGVEREKSRVKATGEIFTPTSLVEEILNNLNLDFFKDKQKNFLDNSCGDGQFLASILYRKLENGINFEQALSTIYGVDLMQDNVDLCRERLLCGREDLRHIVEQNIVCADALTYKYNFPPMSISRKKKEAAARKRQKRQKEKSDKEETKNKKKQVQEKIMKKLFVEI